MIRAADPAVAMAQADQSAAALQAYTGTDQHAHLVSLLEGLKLVYMHEMVSVLPEELQAKQGALRQVTAMLDSVTRGDGFTPRI